MNLCTFPYLKKGQTITVDAGAFTDAQARTGTLVKATVLHDAASFNDYVSCRYREEWWAVPRHLIKGS